MGIDKQNIELYPKSEAGNENETPFYVNEIQKAYIGLADKYIEEEDTLKDAIIDYYSDTKRLKEELSTVFEGQNELEITERIEQIIQRFENDPTFFIEHHQKIFERTAAFSRAKEREGSNPIATEEEYDLGTYVESLETQVRDAVLALQKKGYKTFQSGFREKEGDRRQYIDMYNKKMNLPESFIKSFEEKGFGISLISDSDRTTIYITPLNDRPITLDEWKKMWDEFAENIPEAREEDFSDISSYSLHAKFREKQDLLRSRQE
jgi:hypothetical protein